MVFEVAELGSKVAKQEYKARIEALRVELLNAQFDLKHADFPLIILIIGDDRQARNDICNALGQWMDARHVHSHFFGPPSPSEAERPRFWRYWRALPSDGESAVYIGAWVANHIVRSVFHQQGEADFERGIEYIRRFEKELVDDGALLLKFWLHLPRKLFAKRMKAVRKNQEQGWRVDDTDWSIYENYDEAIAAAEHVVRATNCGEAPWTIVETTDARHRDLMVAQTIRDALTNRLARVEATAKETAGTQECDTTRTTSVLDQVDLTETLEDDAYEKALAKWQERLARATRRAREQAVSSVLVFEGWDAAGKGGAIRRITAAMDIQDYRIVPVAAPTDEEKSRHYLWRFWRQLTRAGRTLIFDRSWYGRVLVERVEGFAAPEEWRRAYGEINDFEEQLGEHGILVLKFWLHIDHEEQLRRFKEREKAPYKKYKITEEDYRNREQWSAYQNAVNDMVGNTSTDLCRWNLIAANDKRHARVEIVKTFAKALKKRLEDD